MSERRPLPDDQKWLAEGWQYLDQAEKEAILGGLAFVRGDIAWPSDWDETHDRFGFTYTIKRNPMGYAVYYGEYHIGQLKRFGKDEPNEST